MRTNSTIAEAHELWGYDLTLGLVVALQGLRGGAVRTGVCSIGPKAKPFPI